MAPTLLMIEALPSIIAEQVKAIQNLQIDKITVWDSGNGTANGGGKGATADFLSGMISALPPVHELAEQAGIELPPALGKIGVSAGDIAKARVAQDAADTADGSTDDGSGDTAEHA